MLVVCGYNPYPPTWGAAMRVAQLVGQLAREHSVTLLCYDNALGVAPQEALEPACDELRLVPHRPRSGAARRLAQSTSLLGRQPFHSSSVHSAAMQTAIDDAIREHAFDVVQVESSALACFDFGEHVPLVLDEHNIESELLARHGESETSRARRWFNALEARKYARLEDAAWRRAAACVVTSEREIDQVRARAGGGVVAVVPNGVDVEFFDPGVVGSASAADNIVFTGRLDYRPNLDGICWFLDEVLPRIRRQYPDAGVTVVGNGGPDELAAVARPGVTVTGLVPDLRPYLASAACVVAPIRMGGGTRLKVLEALAMARPLVSTSLGCEGIDVVDGEHLLVGDSVDAFGTSVIRVLDDAAVGSRLGVNGRRLVVDRYSWDESGRRLRQIYEGLTAGVRPADAALPAG